VLTPFLCNSSEEVMLLGPVLWEEQNWMAALSQVSSDRLDKAARTREMPPTPHLLLQQ
jgi:hypothetical protein